jgi:hypothetical protein
LYKGGFASLRLSVEEEEEAQFFEGALPLQKLLSPSPLYLVGESKRGGSPSLIKFPPLLSRRGGLRG